VISIMFVKRFPVFVFTLAALAACAAPASAQYGAQRHSEPATGENYHFEFSGILWKPDPAVVISSEGLGIPGSDIDFVQDLGVTSQRFGEMRLVLRPARKHKFRADYLPVKYTTETVLDRRLVFNGIAYNVGLPVNSELKWNTWNLFYEYDFISRDQGFAGFMLGTRLTDVEASLASRIETVFAKARGPIPALGGIGRVYFMPNVSLTGQLTFFDMPDKASDNFNGDLYDIDIYGTLNFVNNVGIQVGWRSISVDYLVDRDSGNLDVEGWYIGGVVRF
jgi:hypothetical protein